MKIFFKLNLPKIFFLEQKLKEFFPSAKHKKTKYKTKFIAKSLKTILSLYETLLKTLTTQGEMNLMKIARVNFCRELSWLRKIVSSLICFSVFRKA